jgi:hypothetical protein
MKDFLEDRVALRRGLTLGFSGLFVFFGMVTAVASRWNSPLGMRWNWSLLCVVLGGFILLRGLRHVYPKETLSPTQIIELGLGIQVGESSTPKPPYWCGTCGKRFHSPPLRRGEKLYPAPACEMATRLLEEARLHATLYPPLSAEQMHELLQEMIQLAEETMQQKDNAAIDLRQILLARHQKGMIGRFHALLVGLYMHNKASWAARLEKAPPPNITEDGQVEGSPMFFQIARALQQHLLETDLPPHPFAILGLQENLSYNDLRRLQQQEHPPKKQKALSQLDLLMQREEARWQAILHKRGAYPAPLTKGCPYDRLSQHNKTP